MALLLLFRLIAKVFLLIFIALRLWPKNFFHVFRLISDDLFIRFLVFWNAKTVPPTQVTIAGPAEARQGDTVNFQCSTAASNPAAEIRWTIDGRQRRTNVSAQIPSNEGGWISTSNISISVDSNKRSFSLLCQGINMQLADNVMTTHMLHILCKTRDGSHPRTRLFIQLISIADPPSTPVISGYTEGSVIPAGSSQKLLCMSSGGNPPASLTWFKNDKKVNERDGETVGEH